MGKEYLISEPYILWIDDSGESQRAEQLLKSREVNFVSRPAVMSNHVDEICPPTLQTHQYRYSGLNIIKTFVRGNMDQSERSWVKALIELEEQSKDLFPNGLTSNWPYWIRRREDDK